jgi:bifunctional non-homologous end joining protein LigD
MGADGMSDFFAIHAALARKSAPSAVLVAFDLMHLDGDDLRERPLEERRAGLAELVRDSPDWLQFSAEIDGEGSAAFRAACRMGLEGIVSKRRGSPYRSGRSNLWRKTKCRHVDQFAVIGFVPWGRTSLRSLRLAHLVGGKLVPCGSAGSGLSETMARELRAALDVGRHVVVEVEHRGFTPAGELRHPAIKGWEGD